MSQAERDAEQIKRLKEQLHKSFMQIEEMQKLFQMEMDHNKEEFDEREKHIKAKEEEIRLKYSQIESNMRAKESCFIVDMGEMDVSMDEIVYKKEDTMRDSGIQTINLLLTKDEQRDPEYQMNRLKELETAVIEAINNPPNCVFELFRICNEMCLENCRLRQQILNSQQAIEAYKTKIFDSERIIEKLKRSEKNLQIHNDQLNQLYGQEASANVLVEEQIRKVKEEWNGSKMEIIDLKKQIEKLTELLKTTNRIDTSKLNFNLPSKPRDDVEKPNFLRMSSNAVLIRHQQKAHTPMAQTSYNEADSKTPTTDVDQKYFKRKDRSEYLNARKQE